MLLITAILALAAAPAAQNPALDKAFAQADEYARTQKFEAAVAALRGAGADTTKDGAARTRYCGFLMRWTEQRIQNGDREVAGLAAVDAWFEVADAFEAASKLTGASDATFEQWSEALLNANDMPAAIEAVDAGLASFAASARLSLQRGRVHMAMARKAGELGAREDEAARYAAAEKDFRAAMSKAPKSAAPCERLGELKVSLWAAGGGTDAKLRKEAIEIWTEGGRRDPAGLNLANTYTWLRGDAGAPLSAVLAQQPENLDALWFRGLSAWARNPVDWPGVRDDLSKVLEKKPDFADANFYLGDAAFRRGNDLIAGQKTEDADLAFAAAAKFWAAYLAARGQTYAAALRQGADGVAELATRMTWLAGKAVGYGKPDQAAAIMAFVVALTPDDGFAWQNLAFFQRESGEFEAARRAYERAHELLPDDPQVMNDYAVIHHYYLKDEDELALGLYRQAIARAREMLDAGGLTAEDSERIQTALRDATNNLRKLEAGDRRNF